MTSLELNRRQYLELEKLALGAFAPLHRFMGQEEVRSVSETMRLPSGEVFPLPVVLDISKSEAIRIGEPSRITLVFQGVEVGFVEPDDFFTFEAEVVSQHIFGTRDLKHPGVELFLKGMGEILIGGAVELTQRVQLDISQNELTPQETKSFFADAGWETVVGFQTRNVPHRAHEYLQRVALEHVDGLFIQPLVGRKRAGDYTSAAITAGYEALIRSYFPSDRVLFGVLSTYMRYAGPREAVFHALVRRNYGCTHFIVGRDHAGVGNFYGLYAAHELVKTFEGELGINVMCLHGPYYCSICDGIATEQTCRHSTERPEAVTEISGTMMRQILGLGRDPEGHLMRQEVLDSLRGIELFITETES